MDEIDVAATLADRTVLAKFPFKNIGNVPVKITQLRTSCGCTTAKNSKDVFQPGEQGEIELTVDVGERTGEFIESASVHTDEPDVIRKLIKVHVKVPLILKINPQVLRWEKGEPRTARTSHIHIADGIKIKELGQPSDGQAFTLRLESLDAGNDYLLSAVPPTGSDRQSALAKISVVLMDGTTKAVKVGLDAE